MAKAITKTTNRKPIETSDVLTFLANLPIDKIPTIDRLDIALENIAEVTRLLNRVNEPAFADDVRADVIFASNNG